jgi:hypothetical protein
MDYALHLTAVARATWREAVDTLIAIGEQPELLRGAIARYAGAAYPARSHAFSGVGNRSANTRTSPSARRSSWRGPRVSELETAQVGDLDEHRRAIRVRWTVEENERYRHLDCRTTFSRRSSRSCHRARIGISKHRSSPSSTRRRCGR